MHFAAITHAHASGHTLGTPKTPRATSSSQRVHCRRVGIEHRLTHQGKVDRVPPRLPLPVQRTVLVVIGCSRTTRAAVDGGKMVSPRTRDAGGETQAGGALRVNSVRQQLSSARSSIAAFDLWRRPTTAGRASGRPIAAWCSRHSSHATPRARPALPRPRRLVPAPACSRAAWALPRQGLGESSVPPLDQGPPRLFVRRG